MAFRMPIDPDRIGYPKPTHRKKSIGQRSKQQVDGHRQAVYFRDDHRCIVAFSAPTRQHPCSGDLTIQHALKKGAGGSALVDGPEYLRTMCFTHNTLDGSDADFNAACIRNGWSIPRVTAPYDPSRIPVLYPDHNLYLLHPNYNRELITHSRAEHLRAELPWTPAT